MTASLNLSVTAVDEYQIFCHSGLNQNSESITGRPQHHLGLKGKAGVKESKQMRSYENTSKCGHLGHFSKRVAAFLSGKKTYRADVNRHKATALWPKFGALENVGNLLH